MTFFSFSEVLQIFVLLCWNTKANDFHIIISVSEKLQEIMQRIVAPVDIFHLLPSEPVVTAQITGLLYCFILIRDSGVHMYGCVCVCVFLILLSFLSCRKWKFCWVVQNFGELLYIVVVFFSCFYFLNMHKRCSVFPLLCFQYSPFTKSAWLTILQFAELIAKISVV